MSGQNQQTSTSSTLMPDWVQPYASGYLGRAQGVADTAYQPYAGDRVAGMNQYQTDALAGTAQRASDGSPTMNAANARAGKILNGDYLNANSNPALQGQIDAAQGDMVRNYNLSVAPQMDRAMAGSGSFGNSGVQQMQGEAGRQLGNNLGRVSSDMRNNAYNTGMSQITQTLGLAPSYANQDYTDLNAMNAAGQAYQTQNQRGLDSSYQNFLDSKNYPAQQLDILGNALGKSYGQNTTSTQPGVSTGASVIGGALTAAQIYKLLGIGG